MVSLESLEPVTDWSDEANVLMDDRKAPRVGSHEGLRAVRGLWSRRRQGRLRGSRD